jgi:hypothetical protein
MTHPALIYLSNTYSLYAFEHMLSQYMISHAYKVKRPKEESSTLRGKYMVKEMNEEQEKYIVEISENEEETKTGFQKQLKIE